MLVRHGDDLMRQALSERREVPHSTVKSKRTRWAFRKSPNRPQRSRLCEKSWSGRDCRRKVGQCVRARRRVGLGTRRRINLSEEFGTGGYVPSYLGVDSIVIALYHDKQLRYALACESASLSE